MNRISIKKVDLYRHLNFIAALIYFVMVFGYFFVGPPFSRTLIVGSSILFIIFGAKNFTKQDILYLAFFAIVIFWVYTTTFSKGYFTESAFLLLPNILIAINLKNSLLNKFVFLISYYLFIIILVNVVFIQGFRIQDVFYFSSPNYISGLGILLLSSYYIIQIKEGEKLNLLHVLPILLFSFLSLSRSGIITSIALFVIILFYNNAEYIRKRKIGLSILSIILVGFIGTYVFTNYNIYEYFIKFELKGFETGRSDIFYAYLNDLNIITAIFGVPVNTPPYTFFGGNLHNSILKAHSIFGILSLIIIPVLYSIYKKYGLKLLIIFSVMLMRAFTDDLMFPGYFDYLIIYLVISPIKKLNE